MSKNRFQLGLTAMLTHDVFPRTKKHVATFKSYLIFFPSTSVSPKKESMKSESFPLHHFSGRKIISASTWIPYTIIFREENLGISCKFSYMDLSRWFPTGPPRSSSKKKTQKRQLHFIIQSPSLTAWTAPLFPLSRATRTLASLFQRTRTRSRDQRRETRGGRRGGCQGMPSQEFNRLFPKNLETTTFCLFCFVFSILERKSVEFEEISKHLASLPSPRCLCQALYRVTGKECNLEHLSMYLVK